MANKKFSFLEKLYWNFYYASLTSSSEKQNRERLYSEHNGDCCCSTMFSFRHHRCNASCPFKCSIKKWSFNHHLKTCFTGGRVEEEGVSTSPFPSSLITYYLNYGTSSSGLAGALPIRGQPWLHPEGQRRAARRCCGQGWWGVLRCPHGAGKWHARHWCRDPRRRCSIWPLPSQWEIAWVLLHFFHSEGWMGKSHVLKTHIRISAKSKVLIGCKLWLTQDSNL